MQKHFINMHYSVENLQVQIESLANKELLLFASQWVRSESQSKPCERSGAMANTAGSFNIWGESATRTRSHCAKDSPNVCLCPSNTRRANKSCQEWVTGVEPESGDGGTDYQTTNRQKSDRSCSIGDRLKANLAKSTTTTAIHKWRTNSNQTEQQ